jgi:CHAT domain-containing protein
MLKRYIIIFFLLLICALGGQSTARQEPEAQAQTRIAAQQAFSAAERLRAQPTPAALRQALVKYEEALRLWRAVEDGRSAAYALNGLGKTYAVLGETQQALAFHQQALSAFRDVGHSRGEALALGDLGAVHYASGQSEQALVSYRQALPLLRVADDRPGLASTLGNIGAAHAALGETQQSLEHYQQALAIWRELKDGNGEAATLGNLGAAYATRGELQKALAYHHQSLALLRTGSDQRAIATAHDHLGLVYSSLGEKQPSLTHYQEALARWRNLADRRGEAHTLGGLGAVYATLGELQQVLDYYHQALAIWREVGDSYGRASTLSGLGKTYFALGENEQSLNYYREALPRWREVKDRRGEAYTLKDIGAVQRAQAEEQQALDSYRQALPLLRAVGDRRGEADALAGLGAVYVSLGKTKGRAAYEQARDYHDQALQRWQQAGDRRGAAYARHALGDVHYALGELPPAFEQNAQALQLFRAVGDQRGEAAARYSLARVAFSRGDANDARAQIETALGLAETLRTRVASQELRASYFATLRGYYEFYIALLMSQHQRHPPANQHAAALEASERARARSLLEILTEAGDGPSQGIEPALLAQERALLQQLNAKAAAHLQLLSDEQTATQAVLLGQELSTLNAEYQQVQAQMRARSPRYAALTQPQPLKLAELQRLLDADTLLLEYALGEERSFLWAVTPTTLASFELPKRAEIETAALAWYESLTVRRRRQPDQPNQPQRGLGLPPRPETQVLKTAADLSRVLLEPVAKLLRGKRLVIVADGALQYLPFAALPEPETERRRDGETERQGDISPLIVAHEIVSLPSASTLALLRREAAGRKPAEQLLAVLADPVFEPSDERVAAKTAVPASQPAFSEQPQARRVLEKLAQRAGFIPRLPFTRQEAEKIAALVPQTNQMLALDFRANRALVMSGELGGYRYLHFATHGLLDSERPGLSSLVLSLVDERGAPRDGFLRAHEVYNLKLSAELVTLSACETGLGKAVWGEGLLGLTRGFMYAGAPRVLVSLWSVNDHATAELMARFYRKLLAEGLPPAAALRAAQIEMWKQPRWSAPFYWAGFTLQGEWR